MIKTTEAELRQWMADGEANANVEFKEARNQFTKDEAGKYCAMLANMRGGFLVLGVDDGNPRQVVGSKAFSSLEKDIAALRQSTCLEIAGEELTVDGKRVVVIRSPSRPVGQPVQYKGAFWWRDGDSLVGMPPEVLWSIHGERGGDFSAEIAEGVNINDLDPHAIETFRNYAVDQSGNEGWRGLDPETFLRNMEAIRDDGVTNAALVLFGKREPLREHLPAAEVIYEYRLTDASGAAEYRREYHQGVFGYIDNLWNEIATRITSDTIQVGPRVLRIGSFDERSLREAVLNAIAHRNYQLSGSVVLRQFQRRFEVQSPGGLPTEVSVENILDRTSPRNRRIAELLQKCAMVERSGQGVNLMFDAAIRGAKALPNFSGTDQNQVCLTLSGEVTDEAFVRFIQGCDSQKLSVLGTHHWLAIELVRRERPLPDHQRDDIELPLKQGLVVRGGRGQFILSRDYYELRGDPERFDELREHEAKKDRLIAAIEPHSLNGISRSALDTALKDIGYDELGKLLPELAAEGRVHSIGAKRAARWYPGPS